MKIIYENDQGGVSVVHPAPNALWTQTEKDVEAQAIEAREAERAAFKPTKGNETPPPTIKPSNRFTVEEIAAKDVPNGVEFEIVEASTIPTDRTFRGAWRKGPGRVNVNMPAARVIRMKAIRTARDRRLRILDQRRYGAEYDTERQALRDLPATFDLSVATTPEELKALTPIELEE